jgi:hypothetical protein
VGHSVAITYIGTTAVRYHTLIHSNSILTYYDVFSNFELIIFIKRIGFISTRILYNLNQIGSSILIIYIVLLPSTAVLKSTKYIL